MTPETTFKATVLRTLAEVEQVRDIWTGMQWSPESDIDFFSFIVKSRPEILHPLVLVVWENDRPVALVAGRIEKGHFDIKAGYKVIWRTEIRRLAIFYGGFMGRTTPEVGEFAIRQLLKLLREEQADLLLWSGVVLNSELRKLLGRVPNPLCRDPLAKPVQHWKMTLPESLDELLEKRMSKKHRYWAKRLMRILEKDFPKGVRMARFSRPDEMEKLFKDVIVVARKTYQWGLGAGFRDNEEQRERLRLEAKNGWHRGYVLYLNEEPVAFWICIVYRDTVYSAYTGYDPRHRKYEPGTVLFLNMIGELSREKKRELDFGPGSAFYKERFGDASFMESTLCIFAPSFRGMFFNGLRLVTEGPINLCRSLLNKLGLEQKLKTAWRRRLTRGHQTDAVSRAEGEASQA